MPNDGLLPGFSTPSLGLRPWRVTLPNGAVRTVEATALRCEAGCAVFATATGIVAAFAAGAWLEVAPAGDQQSPARDEGGRR